MAVKAKEYVQLWDYRSRWDGVVQHITAGLAYAERSVSQGEIAIFTPTGEEGTAQIEHETREGITMKTVKVRHFRRSGTRLV